MKKRLKPKTAKQREEEAWEVPGLRALVDPPPRAVVTAVEAKQRF